MGEGRDSGKTGRRGHHGEGRKGSGHHIPSGTGGRSQGAPSIHADGRRIVGLDEAVELILNGHVVAYPTETVYGVGGILDPDVERRIYRLKGRPYDMPLPVAVSSIKMLEEVAEIHHLDILQRFLPGPISFVLPSKKGGTVAVRMPDCQMALKLIDRTGPIYSTSANPHGKRPPVRWEDVSLDVPVLMGPPSRYGIPSTLIDLTAGIKVLRKGPVEMDDYATR